MTAQQKAGTPTSGGSAPTKLCGGAHFGRSCKRGSLLEKLRKVPHRADLAATLPAVLDQTRARRLVRRAVGRTIAALYFVVKRACSTS